MFGNITTKRVFVPGDKWIYFELYTSPLISDNLIKNEIFKATKTLIKEKVISKWFFIRYNNPNYHLRLRLKIKDHFPIDYVVEIINKHLSKYSKTGFLYNIVIGTYQREIERYGRITISNAENIFFQDSDFTVQLLRTKSSRSGHYRWLAGIKSIDQLLNDFNLDIDRKKNFLGELNSLFGKEFNKGPDQAKMISKRYREYKEDIKNTIEEPENGYQEIKRLLDIRSKKIKNDIEKIEFVSQLKLLEQPIENIITSLIHMSMNRLFTTEQRFNEMILYDFLFRYYKSKLARNKYDC